MLHIFTTLAGKVAVSLIAGGAAVVGGTAIAAYAKALPPVIQQAAHDTIGAPSPTADPNTDGSTPAPTATPVGPDAAGPAAFGLCTAYSHGGLGTSSTAYRALVTAANGASNIATYCSTIIGPTATHTPRPIHTPNSHSTTHPTHTAPPAPENTHKPAPGSNP